MRSVKSTSSPLPDSLEVSPKESVDTLSLEVRPVQSTSSAEASPPPSSLHQITPSDVPSEVVMVTPETPKDVKPLHEAVKRKRSRRLSFQKYELITRTALFSGRDVEFGAVSTPHRSEMSQSESVPVPVPVSVPNKGQEATRRFEQNNRIELSV